MHRTSSMTLSSLSLRTTALESEPIYKPFLTWHTLNASTSKPEGTLTSHVLTFMLTVNSSLTMMSGSIYTNPSPPSHILHPCKAEALQKPPPQTATSATEWTTPPVCVSSQKWMAGMAQHVTSSQCPLH